MKRKLKIMTHQVDQLKEEISAKEAALVKLHLEQQRIEKEKETLKVQLRAAVAGIFWAQAASFRSLKAAGGGEKGPRKAPKFHWLRSRSHQHQGAGRITIVTTGPVFLQEVVPVKRERRER